MPAAHAQKPDLQRKPPFELGPTPLFDDPGFLGPELEEHLDLRLLPRAAGAAGREISRASCPWRTPEGRTILHAKREDLTSYCTPVSYF
jgi:hypothetical protein